MAGAPEEASSKESVGVLVVGMHRSGTSTVTRILNLLGFALTRDGDLMPADEANPRGYWESLSLMAFNDRLLSHLGGSWAGPPVLTAEALTSLERDGWVERGREAFFAVHPGGGWAWKDPRVSTLLPFWRRALDGTRLAVVLVHRPAGEIWRSLERRDDFARAHAIALWERLVREALDGARGLPLVGVRYEDVLADPVAATRSLRDALAAFGAGGAGELPEAAIREFVDPGLRHVRAGEDDPLVSPSQRELAERLEEAIGATERFDPLPLPPETGWTGPILAERGARDVALEIANYWQEVASHSEEKAGGLHRRLAAEEAERARLERTVARFLDRLDLTADVRPQRSAPGAAVPVLLPDAERDAEGYRDWLAARRAPEPRLPPEDGPAIVFVTAGARLPSRLVDSLRAGGWGRWQLWIAAACGAAADTGDARVRFVAEEGGGLAASWNRAVRESDAGWVGVVGEHDEIAPGGLAWLVAGLSEGEDVDLVYGDEDRIAPTGDRFAPFFKPDWSPELLVSMNYVGRPFLVRRSLFEEIGGFREPFEGALEHDLLLRAGERARRVVHVSEVLLHRSAIPADPDESDEAGRRAVASALERRRDQGEVLPGIVRGTFRVRRAVRGRPLVSVIIPFRDEATLTGRCVESLRGSGWDHWEALLVDNRSWEPETRALLERLGEDPRCRLLRHERPFNWSEINNRAAGEARGEILLFLNNDVDSGSPGWLPEMISQAQRPEVGAVGARLLYGTGHVQHGGVILGPGGIAGHAFRYLPRDDPGDHALAAVTREWSAVTGACLMVRSAVFRELSGFDESFAVAYNDIDFCLRLGRRGYRVVCTPFAELVHHESLTRGVSSDRPEAREMFRRWRSEIEHDPFYSPHLSRLREGFSLPAPDEEEPWQKIRSILES